MKRKHIDKCLSTLSKKKGKLTNAIRNERRYMTTEVIEMIRIIRGNHEQLFTHKLDNLE